MCLDRYKDEEIISEVKERGLEHFFEKEVYAELDDYSDEELVDELLLAAAKNSPGVLPKRILAIQKSLKSDTWSFSKWDNILRMPPMSRFKG